MTQESCPRCCSSDRIRSKLLLINAATAEPCHEQSIWRRECSCDGGLSVGDLKPELSQPSDTQFIHGLYCDSCGLGFLPEEMCKPPHPRYTVGSSGWRRVYPNGELGPELACMRDDPDWGR